ncbi:hypothetical protein NCCP2145_09140 [Pseudarthrobacter sp. NCCP-2145]|nr:hypothetical protein NCCP2145_09140 [Pseudarthrobacter sp. NCCP-2145]
MYRDGGCGAEQQRDNEAPVAAQPAREARGRTPGCDAAGAADTAGAATQPRFPEESGMWGA